LTDLKKIIKKSHHFPDKVSWEMEDPDSFRQACASNIVDRPECARHMDAGLREKITLEFAMLDMMSYKTFFAWRGHSPLTYWAARDRGWVDLPDFVGHFGVHKKTWSFYELRRAVHEFRTLEEWREKNPKSLEAATKKGWNTHPDIIGHMKYVDIEKASLANLIRTGDIFLFPEDIEFLRDTGIQKEIDAWCARDELWRLYKIAEGIYLKPQASEMPVEKLHWEMAHALERRFGVRIHESCEAVASDMGLPFKNLSRKNHFESESIELSFDLVTLPKVRAENSFFQVRKVPYCRVVSPETNEGRILRALHAVPVNDIDSAVSRVLDDCSVFRIMAIQQLLPLSSRQVSAAIKGYIRREMSSKT